MRPARCILVLAALATLPVTVEPAGAACETPLVSRRNVTTANVLVILDSSGSMNEAIWHDAYDPNTTYSGSFSSASTYEVSAAASYTPSSFNAAWATTPTAYLVNSDGGERAQYPGNYLNWVFFHASDDERAAIPAVTRIQVAKQAVSSFVTTVTGFRYGVMCFNGDDGGRLVAAVGTDVATLNTQCAGITARSSTPLAETLVDALDYFKLSNSGAPIQGSCEKSFVVIVSDGYPTRDRNVPDYLRDYDGDGQDPGTCASIGAPYAESMECSGYLDDVAKYLYDTDLRPDLDGRQNVVTYVVGFNIRAPILESTARQGGGRFFAAGSAAQLSSSLREALADIEAQVAASSSVSVVSAEDRAGNRLYRARFETLSWRGYLEAFSLPYRTGAAPVWEAGALLKARDPDTRQVFTTSTGTDRVELTGANAAALTTLLGAADDATAADIIAYARGSHVAGARDRGGWKLGDIVDAAPVMVGKPAEYHHYLSYPAFQAAHAARPEVVYVGANDGMLHCFDATDGTEQWAYVPKAQLPRLSRLMDPDYCHEFFVNLTPTIFDIHIGGAWRTVLIGGYERGGSGLFALDVTDPRADRVQVLWDVELPELKGSWSRPELVRDRDRGFVLCVGTGLDPVDGQGQLLVLDPADGAVLTSYALGSAATPNLVTSASAFDSDFDGFDDLLYVGDLAGRMWRLDLSSSTWDVSQLFDNDQPIQSAPVLTMDERGRVLVFFGTGRYLFDADLTSTDAQTFYALFDDHSGTLIERDDLVDQTTDIHAVDASARGWLVDLVRGSGERVIRTPALAAGVLYVPSFRPYTEACVGGGESYLYSLDYEDGSAPDTRKGVERNVTAGRVQSLGDGVLSAPAIDIVNEDVLMQSSTASIVTQDIDVPIQRVVVRSWRQVWDR